MLVQVLISQRINTPRVLPFV